MRRLKRTNRWELLTVARKYENEAIRLRKRGHRIAARRAMGISNYFYRLCGGRIK